VKPYTLRSDLRRFRACDTAFRRARRDAADPAPFRWGGNPAAVPSLRRGLPGGERAFAGPSRSNNPGALKWHVHADRCLAFWRANGIAACPFSGPASQ